MIAGEGPTELGSWASETTYHSPKRVGMIEALLIRARIAYHVADAMVWKRIRKYKAGDHKSAERRNVLGLALQAFEANHEAIVFTRDRDRDPDREKAVELGIADVEQRYPNLAVAGGIAKEESEAWILLLLGDRKAESHRDPKKVLNDEHGIGGVEEIVATIEQADLAAIDTTTSLGRWLTRAERLRAAP